jgi:hypothetical protein
MEQQLIAFVGLRRSGKDTAAEALVNDGWKLLKFADGLKGMLRHYLEFVGADAIERMIEGDLKETPSKFLQGKSPRWAMQSLGTEWGRNLIGDNLWVDATISASRRYERVVISDCRFPNEAAAIKAAGGRIVRINRDGLTVDSHPSEQLIETLPFDFQIDNNSTVADLHRYVLDYAHEKYE